MCECVCVTDTQRERRVTKSYPYREVHREPVAERDRKRQRESNRKIRKHLRQTMCAKVRESARKVREK